MQTGLRMIGYCRVSTAGQAENGVSLDMQKDKIKAFCLLHGYQLTAIYEDAGRSAKDIKGRPEFQRCLDELISGKTNGLIVYKLDRAFRSTVDCLTIIEQLESKGLLFMSVMENLNTQGAIGKLFLSILASLSTFERALTAERTSQALQSKKEHGERIGQVPYGFALSTDGVKLIQEPSEQTVIRTIVRYHKTGLSNNAIACRLNERKIPTKNSGLWRNHTVKGILERTL